MFKIIITKYTENVEDILIALFSEMDGFAGLENKFQLMEIYFNQDSEALESNLKNIQQAFEFDFEIQIQEQKNWNAEWESNYKPVIIDKFCIIKAPFHENLDLEEFEHVLTIQPQMSFGTGHHDTTYQMVQMMRTLKWDGVSVLDYGAGTGILAILAKQLGAYQVDALEIEPHAVENCKENCAENQVEVNCILGNIEDAINHHTFDIVLANINKNVLINTLEKLSQKMNDHGILIMSGFYAFDVDDIVAVAKKQGFIVEQSMSKQDWACLKMTFEKIKN